MEMQGIIGVTYRCNARCHMCNIWKNPSEKNEEVTPNDLESLPRMGIVNITGGEAFLREDIEEIISILRPKSKRICISTNGYYTEKIVSLVKKFPEVGIRVSLEGLPAANDQLRGLKDGFDHGLRTLIELKKNGAKDIGFGITISDRNAEDLLELYQLAKSMKLEFATAIVHNAYYFHKFDNKIEKPNVVAQEFCKLAGDMLDSRHPKNWYRAYFNYHLANRVCGGKRPLPCTAATDFFFIDPFGEVRPCNALKLSLGNIKKQNFDTIWKSESAIKARKAVAQCRSECWMIGSVIPAIRHNFLTTTKWVIRHKFLGRKLAIPTMNQPYLPEAPQSNSSETG